MDTTKDDCMLLACEPDVWYGPDGIDALAWADGTPYDELADDEPTPAVPEVAP